MQADSSARPAQEVPEYRVEQAERLDEMLRRAYEVLERQHVSVSNGKVIYHEDKPLEDDTPTLMAITTVWAITDANPARNAKITTSVASVANRHDMDNLGIHERYEPHRRGHHPR